MSSSPRLWFPAVSLRCVWLWIYHRKSCICGLLSFISSEKSQLLFKSNSLPFPPPGTAIAAPPPEVCFHVPPLVMTHILGSACPVCMPPVTQSPSAAHPFSCQSEPKIWFLVINGFHFLEVLSMWLFLKPCTMPLSNSFLFPRDISSLSFISLNRGGTAGSQLGRTAYVQVGSMETCLSWLLLTLRGFSVCPVILERTH